MKRISIDNGHSFIEPEEVIAAINNPESVITFDVIANFMEDEAFEEAHSEFCDTDLHFLEQYLIHAEHDLIIG